MRNEQGRFMPGESGNPKGRAPKEIEASYLAATINSVPLEDWHKVIEKVLALAMKGDMQAVRFLADYIVGKPPQTVDLSASAGNVARITTIEIIKDADPEAQPEPRPDE